MRKMEDMKRNANIDCLRIVCMMMVVSMHYFGWGGVNDLPETSQLNFILASGIGVFCRVAVNCFYMISGYFIKENSEEVSFSQIIKSIVKQYKKIWFYSIFLFWLGYVLSLNSFSWKGLLGALMPIMSNQWWFMTIFIFLLCLKPYIAKLLVKMTNKELIILMSCIFFFDSVQTTVGVNGFGERGAGIMHACFMLVVGYAVHRIEVYRVGKIMALGIYVISCTAAGVFAIIEKKVLMEADASAIYYNSPLIIVASISFFVFFLNLNCICKWASRIAPYVLAIYLLNDHVLLRNNMYENILHCSQFYRSNLMLIHWGMCVIGFSIFGIITDFTFTQIYKKITSSLRRRFR